MYVKLLLIASLLLAAAASGQVTLSGDLYDHVDSIITSLPGDETADLDKYVEPTTTQQTQWQAIIQNMLATDYASAHTLAASLDYRVVEFTDTGSGIPPEVLSKIFEPFYTTKEVGKGTGLGLSISYGIIKEHQGDILVKSEVGEGTTFMIVLPLEKAESEPQKQDGATESEIPDSQNIPQK